MYSAWNEIHIRKETILHIHLIPSHFIGDICIGRLTHTHSCDAGYTQQDLHKIIMVSMVLFKNSCIQTTLQVSFTYAPLSNTIIWKWKLNQINISWISIFFATKDTFHVFAFIRIRIRIAYYLYDMIRPTHAFRSFFVCRFAMTSSSDNII